MFQSDGRRVGVVVVKENLEIQFRAGDQFLIVVTSLRRDSDKCCTEFLEFRDRGIESFQLEIAIRSPHATEKRDYQWPRLKQCLRVDNVSVGVWQAKARHRIASIWNVARWN